jgi:anti-anti-sigma factor
MPAQHPTSLVPTIEVIVTEEVDLWTAALLQSRLDEALRLRPAELVVDLAACPYLDAAGIGMLLQVHRQARQYGAQLILRAPSPRVRRNLVLSRVDQVMRISPVDPGPGLLAPPPRHR